MSDDRGTTPGGARPARSAGASDDDAARSTRRWGRAGVVLVVVVVWTWICFTWLFPWVTRLGLDPTLPG